MVLGTTSGAGKSWLTTALCRYYANQGLKVAPFKAQNMSNNARVVAGGEIGSAQYFQALAARAIPDVRMNPLLLKPEKDTYSQVILMGQVNDELSRMAWRGRSASVWPVVAQALDELLAENDVVVMEGAGSPAEINLKDSDIVNMRVALHAQAACLLVTDIDRGGAFAHLYGTWAMLDEAERKLIRGFVLNKFRGDASLLAPGPQMLLGLTGVPTVATLPMWWQHGLPEEDGVFDMAPTLVAARASGVALPHAPGRGAAAPVARQSRFHGPGLKDSGNRAPVTIAIVAYPRISNLDEFQPLKNVPGIHLKWVRSPAELAGLTPPDWIILPGSKHTSGDLAWLRAQGLDSAVAAHAGRGGAVLGICGGLQMLGEALIDLHGIDGNGPGLGLLPVVTVFEVDKTVQRRQTSFSSVSGVWAALSGATVQGYEIHHGQTAPHSAMAAAGDVAHAVMPDGLAWQNNAGNVLGVYLHGLFEDPAVLRALFGASAPTLDSVFEGLADYIHKHFEAGVLDALIA
ncbi:cobyric acid synthase [Polaromonas eurypsychrophila]|uniref:Cobyric acid synthase n=2 Tax=Polaromonas eurypsychrophila TaxID=1614635 RepID=A0A916SIE9_9BURK|nr:cobyric acid synthase [Polaromonas eurypsychrophila]GGB01787.1 cobyric acid synthase [Polaromonas eurypsychrophila]